MRATLLILAAFAISCATRSSKPLYPPVRIQPAMERQIQNARDAGDGDLRLRSMRRKVAAEPDNLDARLELAALYGQLGFTEVALEHYRLGAERFPVSAAVQLRLARALRDQGQTAEAAALLERFVSTAPQPGPELFSWLGILRDEQGKWREGESAHRAALERGAGQDYLHNNLGYNLLMQGRQKEAGVQFSRALEINPASAHARNNLGMALASQAEQAISHWQSASDAASAHNNMAAVWIEQGRYQEARRELAAALGYNNSHSAALNNLRLVSQLDGKPVHLPAGVPVQQRHWLAELWRLLIGAEPEQKQASAATSQAKAGRGL